jgi:serine/threonine-protein kinase
MPYEEGHSLRDRMRREGPLPIRETVAILRDVCDALAHAHRRGVVHRDIKPENVLLSGEHAMVADFGIARAVHGSADSVATLTGVSVGTPAYMAPEQIAADPSIDHRADIYAVGVVAHEMLAGKRPFDATTPQAILAAHLTQAPEPVTARRTTCRRGSPR